GLRGRQRPGGARSRSAHRRVLRPRPPRIAQRLRALATDTQDQLAPGAIEVVQPDASWHLALDKLQTISLIVLLVLILAPSLAAAQSGGGRGRGRGGGAGGGAGGSGAVKRTQEEGPDSVGKYGLRTNEVLAAVNDGDGPAALAAYEKAAVDAE